MNLAEVMILAFGAVAIAGYVATSALQLKTLASGVPHDTNEDHGTGSLLVPIASLSVLAHLLNVGIGLMSNGSLGTSFYETTSFTALIVVLVAIPSAKSLPGLLLPVGIAAAIAILLDLTLGSFIPVPDARLGLSAHIALSIVAYGLLCLAAITAVLLAYTERGLKSGNGLGSGWLSKMPPLQAIEEFMFRLILLGWALLSAGLLIGVLAIEQFFAQHLAHKTVFSIVSWVLFAALLGGRWRAGWRGDTAIKITLIAFASLAIAFLGSKFILDVVLHRL